MSIDPLHVESTVRDAITRLQDQSATGLDAVVRAVPAPVLGHIYEMGELQDPRDTTTGGW